MEEIDYIKEVEIRFDFDQYFQQYVTNQLVAQYIRVMSTYYTNTPQLNKCVTTFVSRVRKLEYDGGKSEKKSEGSGELKSDCFVFQ